MNDTKNNVIPISLITIKCQWWLAALYEQIIRVEENLKTTEYKKQIQRMADDHFLKISLKLLYEWLVEFDKYVEGFEKIIKQMNSLGNIKLLRNVSEHEIDYYKSNGNNQKEFFNNEYNQSIIRPLIIDDVYYIGGLININNLKLVLKVLDKKLKKNNYTFKSEAIPLLDKLLEKTKL